MITECPAPNLTATQFLHNAENIQNCPDKNKHCILTDKQHGSQTSAPDLPEWCRDWLLHRSNVCTQTPYTKPSAYLASAYEVYLVTLRPQPLRAPVNTSRGLYSCHWVLLLQRCINPYQLHKDSHTVPTTIQRDKCEHFLMGSTSLWMWD